MHMTGSRHQLQYLLLALLLAATAGLYALGLPGDFAFDDTANLLNDKFLQIPDLSARNLWAATVSGGGGPLLRPVSMLSFALNFYFADGFHPGAFKAVNIAIHLAVGIGLYLLVSFILASLSEARRDAVPPPHYAWLPLAVTLGWLVHPLAITNVLYVVQRMNSLATLFTVSGLICYVHGRRQLNVRQTPRPWLWIVGGILGFGLLATLSKENGVLLPLYALVIETTIFRFRTSGVRTRHWIVSLFVVVVALPAVLGALLLMVHPEWVTDRYQLRNFTLDQRLLTESRVLWLYIKWILYPRNAELGLFHDDVPISTDLWTPATTGMAIAGLGGLVWLAYWSRRRAPLVTFGILWFMAGHVLESTIVALELVFEHRNYMPMMGLLVAIFDRLLLIQPARAIPRAGAGVVLAMIFLFTTVTAGRASQWRDGSTDILTSVEQHPNSARANYHAGRLYSRLLLFDSRNPKLYENARSHFLRAAKLDPRAPDGLFGVVILDSNVGRTPDPTVISELEHRLRTAYSSSLTFSAMKLLAASDGEGRPMLPHKIITDLYNAELDNPSLNPATRAVFLSQYSGYLGNQRHAWPDAILLAAKAIETAPREPVLNIDMANLFIAIGQFQAAREQVEFARAKDHIGRFGPDIVELERTIAQHDPKSIKDG